MTHPKVLLTLLLCVFLFGNTQAQERDDSIIQILKQRAYRVSIDEVKQRYTSYTQERNKPIIPRDMIDAWSLITPISPKLPAFKGRNVSVRWFSLGEKDQLWATRITHKDTGERDTATWEACAQLLGCDTFPTNSDFGEMPAIKIAVPDGIYPAVMKRFPYMGFVGCVALGAVFVEQGSALYRAEVPYMSRYVEHAIGLPEWPRMIDDFWRDWGSPKHVVYAYALLSHDLSMRMTKHKGIKTFSRTCFMEIKPNGKFMLHALDDNYTQDERKVFTKLQRAISTLTPHALMGVYLDDGRYLPGHFVHIRKTYLPETWSIDMPNDVYSYFRNEYRTSHH